MEILIDKILKFFAGMNKSRRDFVSRLRKDDTGTDKLEDNWAFNTYLEIYLAWIAVCLTVLAIASVLYYLKHGF